MESQNNNRNKRSSDRNRGNINLLLWIMSLTLLCAGIFAGIALMTPGAELIGATVAIFCALMMGILIGSK